MKTHKSRRNFVKEQIEYTKIFEYLSNIYTLTRIGTSADLRYKIFSDGLTTQNLVKDYTVEIQTNENLQDWVHYNNEEMQEGTNPLFMVLSSKLNKTLCISLNHWLNKEFEVEIVDNSHFVDICISKLDSETIINLLKLFLL